MINIYNSINVFPSQMHITVPGVKVKHKYKHNVDMFTDLLNSTHNPIFVK